MTTVYLPPHPPPRSTAAIALLLFIGVVFPLVVLWLLVRMAMAPLPTQTPAATAAVAHTPGIQEVRIQNWPTVAPALTYRTYATKTPSYPACPAKDGELCEVERWPTPDIVTAVPLPTCSNANLATLPRGVVCRWHEVAPTPGVGMWN